MNKETAATYLWSVWRVIGAYRGAWHAPNPTLEPGSAGRSMRLAIGRMPCAPTRDSSFPNRPAENPERLSECIDGGLGLPRQGWKVSEASDLVLFGDAFSHGLAGFVNRWRLV